MEESLEERAIRDLREMESDEELNLQTYNNLSISSVSYKEETLQKERKASVNRKPLPPLYKTETEKAEGCEKESFLGEGLKRDFTAILEKIKRKAVLPELTRRNNKVLSFADPENKPIHTSRLRETVRKHILDSKLTHFPLKKPENLNYLDIWVNKPILPKKEKPPELRKRQRSTPVLPSAEDYTLASIPMNRAFRFSVEKKRDWRSNVSWKTVKKWIAVDKAQKSYNSIVRFNRNDFFQHKI